MGPGFCPLSRTNGTFLHNILESIDLSPILGPVQCEYTIIQLLFILNNFDSLTAPPPNIPTGGRPCLSVRVDLKSTHCNMLSGTNPVCSI